MNDSNRSVLAAAREDFHHRLSRDTLVTENGIASNADGDSAASVRIAHYIAKSIGAQDGKRPKGQTSGKRFEDACTSFVQDTFLKLVHLRPGQWIVGQAGSNGIATFDQYSHLIEVENRIQAIPELKIALGGDYVIKPDVVVTRQPVPDSEINAKEIFVDKKYGGLSSIREGDTAVPILHASISCKWTMRSDRAQNTRSEALNLIRNRKGKLPHVVVVTAEPLPTRLASIALGTGDIDCVYHFALHELIDAVRNEQPETNDLVQMMVAGKRLKDITDLPLDLAV